MVQPLTKKEIKNFNQEQVEYIYKNHMINSLKEWYLMVNIYKYVVLNCFLCLAYPLVVYHTLKQIKNPNENIYLHGMAFWPNVYAFISFAFQICFAFFYFTSQSQSQTLAIEYTAIHVLFGLFIFFLVCICYFIQSARFSIKKNKFLNSLKK